MPEVTVWPSPNGLPIARTKSPTCSWSESPIGTAVRLLRRDLQHRDVGIGVAADQLGREAPVVLGGDLDAGRVLDDMGVGQHIALRGVDDDAGAGRLGLALLRLLALRQVEKAAEERVLQQRVLLPHPAAHRDVDDARGDLRAASARGSARRAGQPRGSAPPAGRRRPRSDRRAQPAHQHERREDRFHRGRGPCRLDPRRRKTTRTGQVPWR